MTQARTPASPSTDPGANAPIDQTTAACPEKRIIVIDAGHGGTANVPGSSYNNATAVSGKLEKILTLEYAKSLRAQFSKSEVRQILSGRNCSDVQVLLTRETDVNLTSGARVSVASRNKADILISIHFNGGGATARGTETFYKAASNGGQSNEAADRALAQSVNDALFAAIKSLDGGAKNRGAKPDTQTQLGSIGVLRDPGIGHSGQMCRSILIEVEFITHREVDRLLVSGGGAAAAREVAMLATAKALARAL